MEDICMVYVTATDKKEASKIAKEVLSSRLAACCNIYDNVTSLYWWDNKVNKDKEAVLIMKTKKKLFKRLENKIKQIHSYDCPCIVALPISDSNKDYQEWVIKETK